MAEHRARLGAGGRLVIPAEYREALRIQEGDEVVLQLAPGEVRILTPREAVRRAQALVHRHVKKGRSLSRELLEERRAEAKRE